MAQFFVTVDHTKVSADLTDFPIYINLANAPASFWSVVKNGGGDIRVYKSDGITELAREVVSCDTGTDTGELHVKFTGTLSASVDTKIIIDVDGRRPDYAPTATFGRHNVWTNNRVVYHLDNENDSTSNAYHLTQSTSGGVTFASGQVGKAGTSPDNYPGNKALKRINFAMLSNAEYSGEWRKTLWLRNNHSSSVWWSIIQLRSGSPFYQMWNSLTSTLVSFNSATAYPVVSASLGLNTYAKLDIVANGNTWTLYKDGALIGSGTGALGSSVTYQNNFVIFGNGDNSTQESSPVTIDEYRIVIGNSQSSANWIATEYNNQSAPGTFTSWSEQVPKRFALTIDNTKVAADVVDFPVLVDLSLMPARFWATVSNGGGDIRVYKQGKSSELPREVVSCNTSLKTGELWFKYSGTLSSSSPTVVIIEVDGVKTDYAVTASFGRNAVWSDYRAVYHLNDTTDSTGNGYTLTNNNTVTLNATGKLGGAADFTSGNTNKSLSNATDLGMSLTGYTVDMWLSLYDVTSFGQGPWIINDATTRRVYSYYENSGGASMRYAHEGSASTQFNYVNAWSNNTWRKYTQTWDNTTMRGYLDAVSGGSINPTGNTSITTSTFRLGAHQGDVAPSLFWKGLIDEARVTSLTRSAQWITTEYNNHNANATFFSSIAETGQSGWLNIATGTYTGTGGTSGTRAITGIGFRPKFVLVWSNDTAEIYPAFSIDTAITGLGANIAFLGENGWGTSSVSDRFNSFDADGFTISIGSSATAGNKALNKNAATFYYLALGGPDIVTGSYTGNATDNRNITGVGFLATFLMLMGGTNHSVTKFLSSGASTDTSSWTYNAADSADLIQNITNDGFQIGTATQVNANTIAHYWMAIKSGPKVFQSQYTGDGVDNRAITEPGFQPDFVYIKSSAAKNFGLRSSNHSGDLSKFYRSSGFVANYIQSLDATGFTIGNAADINTSSETLRYIAFQDEVTHEVAINETITITESIGRQLGDIKFEYQDDYEVVATTNVFTFTNFACPVTVNGILMVFTTYNNGVDATSVTFNGLSLTKATGYTGAAFFSDGDMWYLVNPPNVTANIVVTLNASVAGRKEINALVYSNVNQTTPINAFNSSYASSGTSASISVTTTVDNCILVGGWKSDSYDFIEGAGTIFRGGTFGSMQAGDSGGSVGVAGSKTLNASLPLSGDKGIVAVALAPAQNAFTVSVSDTLAITESVTPVRIIIFTVSVNDTLTIAESTSQQRSTFASVVDAVAITENVNPNRIFNLAVNDAVLITESVTRQQALVTSVFDAIGITENTTALRSINVSTSDTVTVTENVSRLSTLFATATENVTILESVTQQKINTVNVFDTISIGELTIQAIVLVRSVSDTLTISESVTLERPVTSIQLPQDRYKGTAKRINMKVGGSI